MPTWRDSAMLVLFVIISTRESFKRNRFATEECWRWIAATYSFGMGLFIAMGFFWWRVHVASP